MAVFVRATLDMAERPLSLESRRSDIYCQDYSPHGGKQDAILYKMNIKQAPNLH